MVTKLLTLFHEYNPRLLTVRQTTQIVHCSNCGSSDFEFLPSRPTKSNQGIPLRITECKKCKSIRDLTMIAEDVKHNLYHEYGKEPDDRPEDFGW